MEKAKRQANYELLRIIAMLMVVTLHYLNHTGMLLEPGGEAGAGRVTGMLLESFCIVAVNVYVLISGYFLVEARFRVKRIVVLVCQILFYAILIPLIMMGTGISGGGNAEGIYRLVQYVFPLQTEHYWFATSYVLLYLFTPLLNTAVKNMSKRQLQITLGGLLLLFCGVKSIVPVPFVTDRFGYDFGWFLCVYLTAAYIRLYGLRFFRTAKRAWGIYAGCALLIFAIGCGAYIINRATGALGYYVAVPFHYNYVLCLIGAIALFCAFGHIKIAEGRTAELVRRLAPFSFGVYLFHEHIDIRNEWTGWIENFTGPVSGSSILSVMVHWMISVAAVYAAGTFIDMIRWYIFKYVGRHLKKTRLSAWVCRLDEAFK